MKIAIDIGALATPGDGIARYLASTLQHLVPLADAHALLLYGRGPAPMLLPGPKLRVDGLPAGSGKLFSLATSQPHWARRDRPDVFWGPAHRLPLWLPTSTARVVTIHDLCWRKAPETMRPVTRLVDRLLMPRALRQADRVICVSHATASDVAQAFPAVADRIAVIHEAALLRAPANAASDAALISGGPFMLAVGTREPRKNLTRLVQAFAECRRRIDRPLRLVIAGGHGWGPDALGAQISALGLDGAVQLLGHVDDATLSMLYANAVCLAMPSLYEGFGLPLVEAMSHGTPILTSAGGATQEVAGDAAVLVDPLDVESIAAGLVRMITDRTLRDELARNARRRAAGFSWERCARETLDVLEAAAGSRRQRAR